MQFNPAVCDLTPEERAGINHLHSIQREEAMSQNLPVSLTQSLPLKHKEVTHSDTFFKLYVSDLEDKRCNNNDYTEKFLNIFLEMMQ